MAKYVITEKAGRFVAGYRNTGVGTVVELSPHAADYEIALGTLRQLSEIPREVLPEAIKAQEITVEVDPSAGRNTEAVIEAKPSHRKKKR